MDKKITAYGYGIFVLKRNRPDRSRGGDAQGPQKPYLSASGGLADSREPTELDPPVIEVVQVQTALAAEPVEVRHAAIATPAPQERTQRNDRELSLDIGVFLPEGQELVKLGRTKSFLVQFLEHFFRGEYLVEVHEFEDQIGFAFAGRREVLAGDGVVLPVVLPVNH